MLFKNNVREANLSDSVEYIYELIKLLILGKTLTYPKLIGNIWTCVNTNIANICTV